MCDLRAVRFKEKAARFRDFNKTYLIKRRDRFGLVELELVAALDSGLSDELLACVLRASLRLAANVFGSVVLVVACLETRKFIPIEEGTDVLAGNAKAFVVAFEAKSDVLEIDGVSSGDTSDLRLFKDLLFTFGRANPELRQGTEGEGTHLTNTLVRKIIAGGKFVGVTESTLDERNGGLVGDQS